MRNFYGRMYALLTKEGELWVCPNGHPIIEWDKGGFGNWLSLAPEGAFVGEIEVRLSRTGVPNYQGIFAAQTSKTECGAS